MHKASRSFWLRYRCLPDDIQQVAAKQFAILKTNPHHPSVRFKKLIEKKGREIWSARVTLKYRALAVQIRP